MQLRGGGRGLSTPAAEVTAFGLFASALCFFALIAIAVHNDWLVQLDRSLLLVFRISGDPARPIGPNGLASFVRDITALGSFAVLASTVLAIAGFLAIRGYGHRAMALLGYTLGGTALGEAGKYLFARQRPDVVPHLLEVVTLSFPSAHAMQATVVWMTLALLLAGVQSRSRVKSYLIGVAAVVALAVGISRVFLGVHWPTDVLAGWALGTAWVSACWLFDRRLCARGV